MHSFPRHASPITHADRMPLTIHSHIVAPGPRQGKKTRRHRDQEGDPRYYMGSFEWTPRFERWISERDATGPLDPVSRADFDPDEWWRSPYLTAGLARAFPAALVDGLVALHRAQAEGIRWEMEVWDQLDEAELEAHLVAQAEDATALARQVRAQVDGRGSEVSQERALPWLTRQGERLQRYVWRTYYPGRRR